MSRKSGNRFSDQDMRAQKDSVRELAMQRQDWRDALVAPACGLRTIVS
jgi:hypothetical protein